MLSSVVFLFGCMKPAVVEPSSKAVELNVPPQPVVSVGVPEEMRRPWPFVDWETAKAFTFNGASSGSGVDRYVWSDEGWAESIDQSIDLSSEEAQMALGLIHQTGGGLVLSKCPIVPRHSVVFFNAEQEPVGSMNICFSCEDTLIFPLYYASVEEGRKRYQLSNEQGDGSLLFEEIHPQNMTAWSDFFSRIGAEGVDQRPPD